MTSALAQLPQDTSSEAALVFGMLALVGITSFLAITRRGRRSLMPLVAVGIGVTIAYTSIADWLRADAFTILTAMGLLIAGVMVAGGLGALREGVALPQVEGIDPDPKTRTNRGDSGDLADASDAD